MPSPSRWPRRTFLTLAALAGVPGETSFGDHRIGFAGGDLTVSDAQGRALWATSGGAAFLAAARGGLDWTETHGHFSAERTMRLSEPDQSVDTGRQQPLPEWSGEGAIIGVRGGTDAVRTAVADLRSAGAQLSGVWAQDWSGRRRTGFGDRLWGNWELDRERYPGWEELVDELNADGIRMLTYVNPFLVDTADKPEPARRALFDEALAAGEDEVTVVLPSGEWRHLWSGQVYEGEGEVRVAAPLGRPAVFFPEDDPDGEGLRERLADLVD